MADIEIGEIARIVISFSSPGGSVAQNVFYYECQQASVEEQAALDDITSSFEDNYLDNWADLADPSSVAFLLEMDIINGDGTVDRNIGDSDIDVPGVSVGEILPAAVSGYMQADTERSGSRGRKFVPFLIEQDQEDGYWVSAITAQLAVMLADVLAVIVSDIITDFVPGVLSRVTEQFLEFTGSGYVTNVPAYQRRRKPNVGS